MEYPTISLTLPLCTLITPGKHSYAHKTDSNMVKFTQEGVEAQEKGKRIPKFHFNKFNDYGGGVILLHGSTVHKIVSRIKSG